ncbi:restriction endonuclease subunit S [Azospirillum formosense]|uniref:restriction endonuclease subunit S n=1 Tax=Azospirillum formosense TaxID=861533 RepID=UPI00338DF023
MTFPAYPEYKDSGVEWLGKVPAHWRVCRVKSVADVINGYPFDSGLFGPDALYPLIRIRDLNRSETEIRVGGDFVEAASVTSSDVLIGMDGDFNVGRWNGGGVGLLNQRMCCVRGQTSLLTRILEFTLPFPLKVINKVTFSTTVKHLSSAQVEKTAVAFPLDEQEQSAIVTFLDREISKIDALVAEQEKLVDLLKEKRQAVISHAVTKGLAPSVPMKDSGVEWLGEVPGHWDVVPVKRLVQLVTSGPRGWSELVADEGAVFFQSQNIGEAMEVVLDAPNRLVPPQDADAGRALLKGDDVVICITGARTGAVAHVPSEIEEAYINQHVCLLRPSSTVLGRFLAFSLYSVAGQEQLSCSMYGLKQGLGLEQVRATVVACPDEEEQRQILAFLDTEVAKLDALDAEARNAIGLLKERRSALISAAVTGKIDVRGLANDLSSASEALENA